MYYYGAPFNDSASQTLGFLSGISRVYGTFGFTLQIICYAFTAFSLYTIAKRRGIRKYGLAWVPIINVWILGSISDQYKYVTMGKTQSRRKILLCLSILLTLSSAITVASMLGKFLGSIINGSSPDSVFFGLLGTALLLLLFISVISIVYIVFYFIALYNVYVSCMPGNATLFLVLSIFFRVTTPFFLFACRNKDDGMPPRFAVPNQNPDPSPNRDPWEN